MGDIFLYQDQIKTAVLFFCLVLKVIVAEVFIKTSPKLITKRLSKWFQIEHYAR
jgi:hypothetical protein